MKNFIGILLLVSTTAFAQIHAPQITDANIQVDARETAMPDRDTYRTQDRVRVGFTIDAAGIVEIVGLASTGASFNNDWNTVSSNQNFTSDHSLAFRQLYLRKVYGPLAVEIGALSPEGTVGAAGLAPTGWMDGIRTKVSTKLGDIKVVAGQLGNFTQPDAFQRAGSFKGNFIEIEVSYKVFENLMGKTAFENLNGDNYVRQDLEYDLKIFGDKVFKLFADALYNVEKQAANYELGVQFDVLHTILGKYEGRLDLKLYYSNLSSKLEDRAQTISAFYVYGPRFTAHLSGKIDKKGYVSWFARASIGEEKRVDVGLTFTFGKKKKK